MAYLVTLHYLCDNCHTRRAVVEVFSNRDGSQGKFCRPCGNARVELLKRNER